MWRNALSEADVAVIRRPRGGCQRNWLLLHLWRQPAHHAVEQERGRARACLVEFAVRRQRRIRIGIPPFHRQANRVRAGTAAALVWRDRRHTGHSFAELSAKGRGRHLRATSAGTATQRKVAWRGFAGRKTTAGSRRYAGEEECLDRRRRRLGLRHWLW